MGVKAGAPKVKRKKPAAAINNAKMRIPLKKNGKQLLKSGPSDKALLPKLVFLRDETPFILATFIAGIIYVIIGSQYTEDCPLEPMIPQYLMGETLFKLSLIHI